MQITGSGVSTLHPNLGAMSGQCDEPKHSRHYKRQWTSVPIGCVDNKFLLSFGTISRSTRAFKRCWLPKSLQVVEKFLMEPRHGCVFQPGWTLSFQLSGIKRVRFRFTRRVGLCTIRCIKTHWTTAIVLVLENLTRLLSSSLVCTILYNTGI